MWRAFFYATGFVLILLGLESLVFERIELASGKGMPRHATRILEKASLVSKTALNPDEPPAPVQSTTPAKRVGYTRQSAFGPSRFADGYSNNNTFSASPFRSGPGSNRAVQVPPMALNGQSSVTTAARSVKSSRRTSGKYVYARDWMPWSLLAVGSIVLLYTRSMTRGH